MTKLKYRIKKIIWKITELLRNAMCSLCKGEGVYRIKTPITHSKIYSDKIEVMLCPRCVKWKHRASQESGA